MKERINIMETKVYYIPYNKAIEKVNRIEDICPCFIEIEDVEMGYAEVTIKARVEDIASIERYFADVV